MDYWYSNGGTGSASSYVSRIESLKSEAYEIEKKIAFLSMDTSGANKGQVLQLQREDDEIYNEIDLRLINIENILKEKNLSIKDYFKNVDDITDIDMLIAFSNIYVTKLVVIFIKLGIEFFACFSIVSQLNQGNLASKLSNV